MSKVLFLGMPSHGHMNPTLGLVSELVQQGEAVIYFSSEEFREKIEQAGAAFKSYAADLDIFKMKKDSSSDAPGPMFNVLQSGREIIKNILDQIEGIKIDYIIHSVAFPFASVIKQVLKVPSISSLAVFAGLKNFVEKNKGDNSRFMGADKMMQFYKQVSQSIKEAYAVQMPDTIMELLFNRGDINLIYTSEYFISPEDRAVFDDSFKFVGPPVYDRKENLDFPFEKLEGRKVVYISLGTVFGNYSNALYDMFFKSFSGMDAVIVMAAYNVDLSALHIPENFIVSSYVPQNAILKYATAAVTHAGMNSISDLIYNNIPFVSIPLGADQPALAKRAEELGATIVLDVNKLDESVVRSAVEKVMTEHSYVENIKKISNSFRAAGGYKKAVEEIFKMKAEKGMV